jgi:thiol:disulfide interchange protein DsbD
MPHEPRHKMTLTLRLRFAFYRLMQAFALVLAFAAAAHAQGKLFSPDPASASSLPAQSSEGPLGAIRNWFGGAPSADDLLPPDKAFTFELAARSQDADTLVAELTPAPGYYLYRDRISFSVIAPQTVTIKSVSLPKGEPKADPTFGQTEVYRASVKVVIVLSQSGVRASQMQLRATYQGCNEPLGVCYPPIEKIATVALPAAAQTSAALAVASGEAGGPSRSVASAGPPPGGDASESGLVRRMFDTGDHWAIVAAFFGFGLLLAFTPCMLPMIPILSGLVVGHGQTSSRSHALGLSAVYVLGMAITYAAAGVAAGLAGALLSAFLQNPWVLGSFAAVFVLLALSMFGLFELQLPSSFQSSVANISRRIPGGRITGAFLMGVLSALIVGPCVAAPLAGALLYIGQTRDAVLGGAALFSMAIGMGVPLLVVGTTAGAFLRRAGPLTQSIKRLFGALMLALAIYLISPVIPLIAQQLLWAALLIVSAMFVHAIDPLPPEAAGHRRLFKGVGVIALVGGIALLVGALSGSHDLLQPLGGIASSAAASTQRAELAFQPVRSVAELDARVQSAGGRYVMLDFWAEWCVSCKEMDRFTFSDPRVQARPKDALVLRADVTANNADDQALLRRFALFGPPGIVFFDPSGRELPYRVIGFEPPEKFLASLKRAMVPPAVLGTK